MAIVQEMLNESQKNNWDYRFLSSTHKAPMDANKFGLRIIDTSASGLRQSKKKYKDFYIII